MCGIAMINVNDYPLFSSNRSTLKETSKDDSNTEYMTESEIEVINFDKVKEGYVKELSAKGATSLDALAVFEDRLELIEFKNGCVRNELKNVEDKIRDSLLFFCDIMEKNITYTRNHVDFILVYNESKNKEKDCHNSQAPEEREAISSHLFEKAREEKIRFRLDKFKKLYFRNVHTYTEQQFKAHLGEA